MNHSPNPSAPVIPDHQIIRLIGRGSYGDIWLARNVIGTYRAVKIVYRANFDDARPYEREFKGIKKFEPISRSHPGLVDVLQIGRDDDAGYFYYVMELADDEVSGTEFHPDAYSAKTLGRELAMRKRLPAGEVLEIGINLADALAHLHKAGLVHRDIKPSNIIFVMGQPKLADIGLVVSLADARTFVGTEGFIPPEGPGTIQADIYSLGKVLYEISTGQDRQSFPELPNEVSTFPDRETVAELNEVVVKACANTPQARYDSAEELRADLEMLLAGRSVKRLHFVERQLARAKRLAIAVAFVALALGIFAYGLNHIRNREKELLAKAYATGGAGLSQDGNLHAALPLFAEAWRLQSHDPAAAEAHRLRIGSALQQSPRLLQFWDHETAVSDLRFSADGQRLLIAGGKTARFVELGSGTRGREYSTGGNLRNAALSPDDRRIAFAGGRFVTLLDAASGEVIFDREMHGQVFSVEFNSDGQTLVVACARDAHFVDASTGRPHDGELTGHIGDVNRATFSPDGSMVVTAGRDGTARLWDVKTLRLLWVLLHAQWVQDAAFSPDGRRVVTASSDHTVWVWEVFPEPKVLSRMEHQGGVTRARFSPDGRWVVSAGLDHTVRLWDTATGKAAASIINMRMPALHAVFSAEGRRVAIAGQSGKIRLWDVQPDSPLGPGNGCVSADGERYVTWASNSFRVWNAHDDLPVMSPIVVPQQIASVSCSADAGTVAAICEPNAQRFSEVHIYHRDSMTLQSLTIPATKTTALSPDGKKFLIINRQNVSVWNSSSGEMLFGPRMYADKVAWATFSPDNRTLLLAAASNVFVLDAQSGAELFPPLAHSMPVHAASFTHDSLKFATVTADAGFLPGAVYMWDARTGRPLTNATPHTDGVRDARFTRDQRFIATAGEDSYVAVCDARTGAPRINPVTLAWQAQTVDISTNDRWMMGTSWFGAQLWDIGTGLALTPVFSAPAVFDAGGFCAHDTRIWVQSRKGLLFWDLPRTTLTPEEVIALAYHLGVTIPTGLRWNPAALTLTQLGEQCAADRARFQAGLTSWHRQQARLFEEEGDWFAAQFHLEQLLKRAPNDEALLARLKLVRSHRMPTPAVLPAKAGSNPSL